MPPVPHMSGRREGETALAHDPAAVADATVAFIGTVETAYDAQDCPKNIAQARATGRTARLHIDPPYRPGLEGIAAGDAVIVLYWMAGARRDLIRQMPRHRDAATGVFALRSPARPNPVALAVVRVLAVEAGVVTVDAMDCWSGTPLIDIKPYLGSVDIPPPINQ